MVANEAKDSMLSAEILARMRDNYIQTGDPSDIRASPLLGPLTALPPTLILCSKTEVLRDDSRRLAEAMRSAGTHVTLSEFAGQPHVFPLFRILPAAGRALAEVRGFVA
jgi:monoterpene epsilon-lactone hydrolase